MQVQELIDSGKAREQMEAFITLSNQIWLPAETNARRKGYDSGTAG